MSRVRASLRRLHSPDAPDLAQFRPSDPKCFGLLVQAMYGPDNGSGEESFDIVVCTPSWLERKLSGHTVMDGRHHLFMADFDLDRLRAFLDNYGKQCAGNNWQQCAAKLSRLGKWEFEDYQHA